MLRSRSPLSSKSLARSALLALAATALVSCKMTDVLSSAKPEASVATRVTSAFVQSRDPQGKIGAAEHPRVVASNGGAYEDEKLEALLAVVVADLVAEADKSRGDESEGAAGPQRAFKVTILDSPKVNAFALPGGYLYVTRGLIALSNDAAEIAAVLAHEMAHVSASHGVERIARAKSADIAARVATQVVSNGAAKAIATTATTKKLAAFSQEQERQADMLGIRLAGGAGFDAFAASRFLLSLRRWSQYQAERGTGSNMMSTHPSTPQRVKLARAHARRFGPAGTGRTLRDRYLAGVDGLVFGDAEAQGFVRGRRFSHKTLGFTFAVPEGFSIRNKAQAALATGPNETAVRFDTAERSGEVPADYIASGWVNGLDTSSIQTGTVNGLPVATARASAGAWNFAVAVFASDDRFFRFITAAPRGRKPDRTARFVTASFRKLTKDERAALKPLRLALHTVKQGETVRSLAAAMPTGEGSQALLRTLNALDAKAEVRAGDVVKVVASGPSGGSKPRSG